MTVSKVALPVDVRVNHAAMTGDRTVQYHIGDQSWQALGAPLF
jgi:hypothetical protein